ncbi:MAG TPA: hypothetical protein VL588_10765 [Bdellovibrionota bacterium]|nr:hypothetical protein [Bdellovibrionota bacterium]
MKTSLKQSASLLLETLCSEGGVGLWVILPLVTVFFALGATNPF